MRKAKPKSNRPNFVSAGNLALPNGRTMDLVLTRERLVELTAHRGLSPERQRAYLKRQMNAIDQLTRMATLKKKGLPDAAIARVVGVHPKTVRQHLALRVQPRGLIGEREHRAYQQRRKSIDWKRVLAHAGRRAKLAYCTGALFGNLQSKTSSDQLRSLFQATVASRAFAQQLARNLRAVSGAKARIYKQSQDKKSAYLVSLTNVELVQFMNRTTMDQTEPPHALLKSERDFQAFSKGYWDSRGGISSSQSGTSSAVIAMRVPPPSIRPVIEWYLKSQAIRFHFTQTRLVIDRESYPRFAKKIGFVEPEKQKRLRTMIAGGKTA